MTIMKQKMDLLELQNLMVGYKNGINYLKKIYLFY